ncbi:hypothetical protein JCM19294_2457 [Nonlabens tegetincola]|uniref:Uncharacterized protein n=1 Tax=Nonlabens tegetincola TaxID=323273 RepID=A0A090PY27_9FLAO|nr:MULTISPECIES: hypothetical protein [Nonlabens]MEE2802784.1 hypothetical protein [Bacteroidota bacterium]ALM20885.1 hypothetical protein AAT17_06420 [Nonlabens sp. MIC269]ARN72397.1 hypothetical protein BST91_12360 [Nonlabens tegetincola]PQJ19985.1 hypothetical protein BST93_00635 [Nonlabens tegetincola]GAK95675.1 hypothetical protein JCM19294_2457 [Nonlabens tegetincola]
MSHQLELIKDKLQRHHVFSLYRNQINKDLERSGYPVVQSDTPDEFLESVIQLLSDAIEDSDPKLQQLYYLADVQERHLEHGIVIGFLYREWVKIQFRLRQ